MSINDWLDQAEARADAASKGPWERHDDAVWGFGPIVAEFRTHIADAEFIAASRTDLPAAIAALRAVLDLVEPLHPDDAVSEADQAVERQDARVRDAIATALGVSGV